MVINFVVTMAGEAYDAHAQEVQNGNSGSNAHQERTMGPNRQSFSFHGTITGRYHFHSIDAREEIAQTVQKSPTAARARQGPDDDG
jgi:hypothetical protein